MGLCAGSGSSGFVMELGADCQGMALLTVGCASLVSDQSRQSLRFVDTDQSGLGISSAEVGSSQVILGYVKLTVKTNQHRHAPQRLVNM